MGMSYQQLTAYLWQAYHPYNIWFVFTGIGLLTVVALFLYNRFLIRGKS